MYIPLPNHLHAEWTLRAAAAGKHVLCEKPLALSAAEAPRWSRAVARRSGLMEAFMYRLHPMWQRVRELVTTGTIGELEAIQVFFSYRNVDPANIRNIAEYGGGALMDIGCYASTWPGGCSTANRPTCRRPSGATRVRHRRPDLGGARLRRTPRHVHCSTQIESDQRVHLVGTTGRLLVEIPFNIPPDRPTRIVHAAGGDPPVAPGIDVIEVPAADPYGAQGDAFSTAVRDGSPVPIPPEDAVGNMTVIERILADSAWSPDWLDGQPFRG